MDLRDGPERVVQLPNIFFFIFFHYFSLFFPPKHLPLKNPALEKPPAARDGLSWPGWRRGPWLRRRMVKAMAEWFGWYGGGGGRGCGESESASVFFVFLRF